MNPQPVQTQPATQRSVKSWLQSDTFKTQVQLCLPKHLTADRFVRVALSALGRNPKIGKCTPESVLKCMMTCSELGIEPDGRRAHLIPFGTECTLIIDYKGLVELAKRSGDVSNIHAQTVCDDDFFEYDTGRITHKIDFKKPRGNTYAVYTVIKFKDGGEHTEVMTKDDVDRIRKRSRASANGPWVTDYDEMAKKTVFRRASKWLTLSPEVQDALDRDADTQPGTARLVEEVPLTLPEGEPELEEAPAIETRAEVVKESTPPPPPPRDPEAGAKVESTPQDELADFVIRECGSNYTKFQEWGMSGPFPEAEIIGSFAEMNAKDAKRMLNAKIGLRKALTGK